MTGQSSGPAPAPLVDQRGPAPTRKWVAGVSTGTATIFVLWVARQLGLDLPPAVGEAIVVAAAGAAAWVKRNRVQVLDVLDRGDGDHLDRDGDGIADR